MNTNSTSALTQLNPVLRVASGDTVRVETMLTAPEMLRIVGVSDTEIPSSITAVDNSRPPGAIGNALTGPIYVEGAEPGDMLEVRILKFEFLHPYGWTQFRPNKGTLPEDFPYHHSVVVEIDPKAGTGDWGAGVKVPLGPFFGNFGVAPPAGMGRVGSGPPGGWGGNLDNKDLVAGSTLYLPVHVPGALLSFGDGHGLQGDGRLAVVDIDSPVGRRVWHRMQKLSNIGFAEFYDPSFDTI